jgi:acyl dehydratase
MTTGERKERFFEDFQVGQKFHSTGKMVVTVERIKQFSAEYDPQPFHLNEDQGKGSLWGGMVASGWLTAAMTMRMVVESDTFPAGGAIGAGVEELRWPNPVRPGDTIDVELEVLETRPSKSRPELGIVKMLITTRNQARDPVQTSKTVMMVRRRTPGNLP